MKKLLFFLALIPFITFSQVGVNTTDPKTALDVIGAITNREVSFTVVANAVNIATETSLANITGTGTATVVITSYTPAVNGHRLIISNNTSGGFGATFAGVTIPNSQSIEFVYSNGAWKSTSATGTGANIYNADGTLSGNRVVNQGANNLTFSGTGNTFFNNGNVGIGIALPTSKFQVNGVGTNSVAEISNVIGGNTIDNFVAGINNCGSACGQGTSRNIVLYNTNLSNSNFAGIYFVPSAISTSISGSSIEGIDRDFTNGYAGLAFKTRNSTNFAERLVIKSSGNVGIGTATPATKLDVAAGTTTTNTVVNATGSINDFLQFNVQNTSTGTQAQSGYSATADNGSATTGFAWMGINNSAFNYPTAYNIGLANDVSFVGSGQDLYLANANNTKSIIFSTGKSTTPFFNERMRITNAGNVGISTATPVEKMHLFEGNQLIESTSVSSTATSKLIFKETGFNDVFFFGSEFSGIGDLNKFHIGSSSVNSTTPSDAKITLLQGGNVGIGTTTPAQKLTIVGSSALGVDNGSTFQSKNATGSYENFFWPRWTDNVMYMNYGANGFNIRNNASASTMFMTNSGFVGFGVTPITKLDVSGVKSTGAGTGTGGGNDAASQAIIPAGNNGASRYNDWPAGWGGGISTYDIVGASTFFNSYLTRSDFRLKNDIKSIDDSVFSNFMKIRPVTYFMKEQTKEMEGLQYGFIAQEIRDLFPSMVTKSDDPNGIIGMNYQALISPTIYVVQQQQAKIDELQKQVDTQNEKLSKMEEELKQIKQMLSK